MTNQNKNYRAYILTNYYLSQLQCGLQSAHVVSEMSLKNHKQYKQWAEFDKTMIILNGGNSAQLAEFEEFCEESIKNKYCWAAFREDEKSLNNALTAVGIILPESVYGMMKDQEWPDSIEGDLMAWLEPLKLA
jgi:hypothetical protein